MELLKNIKGGLNFQERYSDMEGSEGGFSGKDRRALKRAQKSGLGLRDYQKDRKEYLDTVGDERTRAIGTGISTVGGVAVGAFTGNPALITSSLSSGANYLTGEMAENEAGNDGIGQQLGFQDAMDAAAPFMSMLGQGQGGGPPEQFKQGGKLRYNPRKYDYIKGNTFGL